ncbi:MAG: nickel pincer cofactor biosynthesis protein LarC [Roseburia intestinalis]
MKTLYIECNMGVAGDMLMGALYELCDQKEKFLSDMNQAFAPYGVTLSVEPAVKCGISGTHMKVAVHGEEEHSHDVLPEHIHEDGHMTIHAQEESPTHDHGTQCCHEHVHDEDTLMHSHEHTHDEDTLMHSHEHTHDEDSLMHVHDHIHDENEHTHTHDNNSHHEHHHTHAHTSYTQILEQIHTLPFPSSVKDSVAAVYRLIGEAESKVHHSTLDQIHFHEVGSIDALVDVTGCAYLLSLLEPETILCSPVHVGNGFVHCAHGTLPVPAPATAELLKGIPFYSRNIQGELCTPTGAAVLKHFVTSFEAMPPMNVTEIGYGMGTKDFAAANCVRVFLGESSPGSNTAPSFDDSVLSISCNLDDMTGEAVGFATELLLQAGALDVYTIPIQMKKNRPGILLTCICEPKDRERLTSLFFLHTTTRGVRYQMFDRAKLTSEIETCHSAYGDIRIKKSCGYGVEKEKAEFEDLKAISAGHNYEVSLDQIRDTIVR